VTRDFILHLWRFLLRVDTAGSQVLLIDGNAQPIDEGANARFVRAQNTGPSGLAPEQMIAKACRIADSIWAVGVPVMMGGPHVTEY
jgi:hypothetical protein